MTLSSMPLGYCAEQVRSRNTGGREQNLLSLSYGEVVRKDIDSNEGLLPESFDSYNVVEPGDTILRLTDLQNDQRSLRVGLARERGIITSAYVTVRPGATLDSRFLNYFLKHMDFQKEFYALGAGVRQSLKFDELRRVEIPIPLLSTQRAIADYLDTETARIGALIEKKKRMIELLEERRVGYVSQAVTSGFREKRDLVQTNSSYASSIPAGWRLMRLRHVVERIVDTPHKTAPVVDGGQHLVVRTANVKRGQLVLNNALYTDTETWIEWNRRAEPRPGDVMLTREAPAGEACLVPADQTLCIGQRMVLLQVDNALISGEWLVHSIYSGAAQRFIADLGRATTVAHINMSDIPDIPVVVPNLSEQNRILDLVRREIENAESAQSALDRQINLLTEKRQALITAAVTGELEIPGVAA